MPYLRELGNTNPNLKVTLVVQEQITKVRAEMGWEKNLQADVNTLEIVVNPDYSEIERLLGYRINSVHFFSGIRSYPMVKRAFSQSLKFDISRCLLVEGPMFYKYSTYLYLLRTNLLEKKYFRYVDKIYAIGHHAIEWYSKFNSTKEKIVPFIYVVDKPQQTIGNTNETTKPRFLYVGSLIRRKGVDILFSALSRIKSEFALDIVGAGSESSALVAKAARLGLQGKVSFLGSMKNHQIRKLYQEYDVHILPSRHDGWGAVVNEALMSGCFVICSNACGASELIQDKRNGIVFSINNAIELVEALNYCIDNIGSIRSLKPIIKEWSKCIEGNEVANYLLKSLVNKTVSQPWAQPVV